MGTYWNGTTAPDLFISDAGSVCAVLTQVAVVDGGAADYQLLFQVESNLALPHTASVGPGNPYVYNGLDLGAAPGGYGDPHQLVLKGQVDTQGQIPYASNLYQLQIDGEACTTSISGLLSPPLLAPVGVDGGQPTFAWTFNPSDPSAFYEFNTAVFTADGGYSPYSTIVPYFAPQISYGYTDYNPLGPGTYQWVVVARDQYLNTASAAAFFTVP